MPIGAPRPAGAGPSVLVTGVLALACATAVSGCGLPASAAPAADPETTLVDEDVGISPAAVRGREAYGRWCVGCHGVEGRGDGPASEHLDPLPRDFQGGRFKFRSTATGELPTQDDLVRTITRGLAGSSMPAFPLVPEPERRDLAEYVLHLALLGRARVRAQVLVEQDGMTLDQIRAGPLAEIRADLEDARRRAQPIGVPVEPPADEASVARGKALYRDNCLACHGESGTGDGVSSHALRDSRDAPILPRDFTAGVLRGGSTPQDLYRRLRTGLDGSPMAAFGNSDQELWDIVHFVLTLRRNPVEETVR